MWVKLSQSGFLSSDEVFKLVEPFVMEIVREWEDDARLDCDVYSQFGFVPFQPKTKKGLIKTKYGIMGSPIVGERDEYTLSDTNYGPDMTYGVVRTFPWSEMTSEAKKWLEAGKTEGDIPTEIKAELWTTFNNLKENMDSIKITENEYAIKCFVKGFDAVSATYWPGSAVYDGKSLFSKTHIVWMTGEQYSNIVEDVDNAGQHAPLNFKNLKRAVEMLRNMKDGQGVRLKRPSSWVYDLFVAPELEATALDALADGNGFSPYTYSGSEAQNGNFANIFVSRDGFKVRLNVVDLMNQPDSQNPWSKIGSDKMWFVLNKEMATKRKAFRKIILGDTEISVNEDEKTKGTFATAEKFFGAQILYPEVIVGSKWDNSAVA